MSEAILAPKKASGVLSMTRPSLKTEDDLLHELAVVVDRYESDADAARAFNVSRSHLSRVLRRQKPITAKIARGLGYERQFRFVRLEERR